jgi:hypothetical protein
MLSAKRDAAGPVCQQLPGLSEPVTVELDDRSGVSCEQRRHFAVSTATTAANNAAKIAARKVSSAACFVAHALA